MDPQAARSIFSVCLAFLGLVLGHAQENSFTKNFRQFREVAPGVDFFAGSRADVAPFEKGITEAQQKLAVFLGNSLAKGAIVVCSTLEQKDSVSEPRVLRMGYRWVLIQLTPAASAQQMLAQMKSQMGGQLPPGLLERLQNQSPEMKSMAEARLVASTVQRFGYAVISMTLAPDREFRSSRVDDVGRSPLSDWLDIGLVAHSAGSGTANLRFLQDRFDESFPIEDVLAMSRPFVAPSAGGSGSAGGDRFVIRTPGGPGAVLGGAGSAPSPGPGTAAGGPPPPGPAAGRGGPSMSIPKDVQDRMMFDAQAASFFAYCVEKAGVEKIREIVQLNRDGKDVGKFLTSPEILGLDLDKIEKEWQTWVKAQKAESPIRIITNPGRPSGPPQ